MCRERKREPGSRTPKTDGADKPAHSSCDNRVLRENCVLIFLGQEGIADSLQLFLLFLIDVGEGEIELVERRDNG